MSFSRIHLCIICRIIIKLIGPQSVCRISPKAEPAQGWASRSHMSEVNPGATVPEVTALLTNQGSKVRRGSLGLQSGGLWDGLFWAAQGMDIQRGLALCWGQISSTCDCKRAEEQNPLLFGAEECDSGVNSQATACGRIVILRFTALKPPVCPRGKSWAWYYSIKLN